MDNRELMLPTPLGNWNQQYIEVTRNISYKKQNTSAKSFTVEGTQEINMLWHYIFKKASM